MSTTIVDPPRWKVRITLGTPRLIVTGDGKYQEFSIHIGHDEKWMASMLRKAMRRLCPQLEDKR